MSSGPLLTGLRIDRHEQPSPTFLQLVERVKAIRRGAALACLVGDRAKSASSIKVLDEYEGIWCDDYGHA